MHSVPSGTGFTEISGCLRDQAPAPVLRAYLAEATALISGFDAFEVLAHIDYPVRYWPRDARPFDPREFQDEYRHVLRTLATLAAGFTAGRDPYAPWGRNPFPA